MQDTLDRPAPVSRHRFDVEAYYRMGEAGVFASGDRVELIEGEIVDMAPIGSGHGGTLNRLGRLVARVVADGRVLAAVQNPLRLDAHNEPQPDLMLLRPRADDYRDAHPTPADVLLLVEVADSSLAFDRGPKLALYARHAVPEVSIVDLAGRAVEIFRSPAPPATPSGPGSRRGRPSRCWCRHFRSTWRPSSPEESRPVIAHVDFARSPQ